MNPVNAIELCDITKTFNDIPANNKVCLQIRWGEILSLLGENGSGKTTLMNILAGIYFPDSGTVYINGNEVTIRSPKDAYDLGIGMIHQHFKLVDNMTAAENIVLGLKGKGRLDRKAISAKVREIGEKYGFNVNPDKKIYDMSVSEKQTVEIIKVLYRGANILILDEPTAVLTAQEAEKLFDVLKNMRDDGKAIIIITHKLQEVMAVSDRVAVLRKGEYAGTVNTKEATVQSLTEMMVGRTVSLNIERPEPVDPVPRMVVKGITSYNEEGYKILDNVSFTAYGGEILGIAGISGCGQKELLEGIAGIYPVTPDSSVEYYPDDTGKATELVGKRPMQIRKLGVALSFVPEDRLGMGLVGSMDITDNMMLRSYLKGKLGFTDRNPPKKLAENVVEQLNVVTPGITTPVSKLSGGNVQKVLVGREIAAAPKVLMTAYAVRGLDINTSYTIYSLLNEQKKAGVAVIYVGEDLDVLLELCDRILVLCGGKVSGIVDGRSATKEQIGLMMTSLGEEVKK
ncbi:MAG: ABC transporter ATP-binding protein [Clostridiaceae bacterium]|nr:ABC transporter ATP-binding protein [Clostridiaceae bacterium]